MAMPVPSPAKQMETFRRVAIVGWMAAKADLEHAWAWFNEATGEQVDAAIANLRQCEASLHEAWRKLHLATYKF